ncbi:protein FAR1-RELATED SEQUENCE 5-like [Aegilops tauschii subsp. strangulata]|uniref:protein FAR1-RELATED SEQUENCE 5-like n=1 Tax=Aegilops tauschii subsp. strangulata TaxID=200361 RepID=UPI00098A0C13|nr:protein FAR1-RELATED SEQUENCE 5-like [Aegilops tauschii subsp. strangulata]
MDEESAFGRDENDTDKVTKTDNDNLNEDDDSSDNDSVSSYDILPLEDFDNSEHGANSENEDVDVDNEESDGPSGDHDEGEIDIEEAQRQQKMLETHWKVMAMTFRSQGDAYIFYNNHTKEHGFSIRKQKVKRGASGMIRYRRFLCSRAGRRQSKFITMEGRKRRLRPETHCDYGAHMVVKLDRERAVWFLASFVDDHNHAMARPDEVCFLWSHRRIGDGKRAEILAMEAARIRKHILMHNFISRYGSYNKCGLIRRDIYNLCCREKMKLIAKGDAETAVGIMRSKKEKDPEFFFEYVLVVVFDSTYKMNRYGMPFVPFVGVNNHRCTTVFGCAIIADKMEGTYVWLLQTFMKANYQVKPKSIITDGDTAMIRAIWIVLSDVFHRLCSWHIEKNMQRHLHYKSLDEFKSLLYYATSQANFEQRWTAFYDKWKTDRTEE